MAKIKQKQKNRITKRGMKTKIIPVLDDEGDVENEGDEDENGMFLEKEDIQLIYNALSRYKPTEDEEHLRGMLLEQFEEILVVDYGEPYPDVN